MSLSKGKLDAWAEETKRQTTGLFRDAQQAHAIEKLIDKVAELVAQASEEAMNDARRAADALQSAGWPRTSGSSV